MCVQHVDGIDNVCLCKQCIETKLYIIGSIKSSRDDIQITSALSVRKEHMKD